MTREPFAALANLAAALRQWRSPMGLLILMAAAVPLSFATWQALLNNFAIERAAFTGVEMGILQSLREVPGFLAFTAVFVLLVLREQTFALLALALLGIGTALTGFFPTVIGLYATTVLMSVGFHYFETVNQSLALQWLPKESAAQGFGRILSATAFASIATYGLVWVALDVVGLAMKWVYLIGGGATVALVCLAAFVYPRLRQQVEQRKHLVLRPRYWLYYLLVFMSGARRQIFVVFAGFLMVERFGFDAGAISLMFLFNATVNMVAAPRIGRFIGRIGERRALTIEYVALIGIFTAYAFVSSPWVAIGLYVIDHLFFTMAIAIKTYFQKVADPADIASTAGVSFTINHIAAVVIPAAFGFIWIVSPAAVFLIGAAMAAASLLLARLVPPAPSPEVVAVLGRLPALFRPAAKPA